MRALYSIIVFFTTSMVSAQFSGSQTTRVYELNSNIQAKNFIHHSQGGIVVCGSGTYLFGQNQYYASFITSLDSLGSINWSKTFTTFTSGIGFNKMMELENGHILVVGFMHNPIVNQRAGLLLCIDVQGQVVWQKSIGNGFDYETHVNDLIPYNDSSVLITGSQYAEDGCSFLANLSYNGDLIWTQSYQNETLGKTTYFKALERYGENEFVVVGAERSTPNEFKGIVLKTDSLGQIIHSMKSQEVGVLFSDILIDSSRIFMRNLGNKNGLIKFNSNFEVEWNNYINDNEWSTFESIEYLNRGISLLDTLGAVYSTSYFSYGSYHLINEEGNVVGINSGPGGSEQLLFDSTGVYYLQSGPSYGVKKSQELFNQHFAITREETWNSSASFCIDHDLFMNHQTGTIFQFDTLVFFPCDGFSLSNAMLEEIAVEFTTDNNCVEFLGAVQEIQPIDFVVFPNPANENISVSFGEVNGELKLKSIDGKAIKTFLMNNGEATVSIGDLKAGYYFIEIGERRVMFYKNE